MALYVLEGGDEQERYSVEAAYTRGEDISEVVRETSVDLNTFAAGDTDAFQEYVRDRCEVYGVPMTDAVEFFETYRPFINDDTSMVARIEEDLLE